MTSQQMLRARCQPGECWYNAAPLGAKPRWVLTTWAALAAGKRPK